MSIINDALKKAQAKLANRTEVIGNQAPIQEPQGKNTVLVLITSAIVIGLIICIVVFVLFFRSRNRTASSSVSKAAQVTNDKSTVQLTKTINASTANIKKHRKLELNGIMTMDGNHLALINNKIFKAGDYIEDMRVISINIDKVEIFDNGEIIVLRTTP